MSSSRALYRQILREASKLQVGPVAKKIRYNTREVFDLYRHETNTDVFEKLRADGAAAVRVITWLRQLSQVASLPARLLESAIALCRNMRKAVCQLYSLLAAAPAAAELLAEVCSTVVKWGPFDCFVKRKSCAAVIWSEDRVPSLCAAHAVLSWCLACRRTPRLSFPSLPSITLYVKGSRVTNDRHLCKGAYRTEPSKDLRCCSWEKAHKASA